MATKLKKGDVIQVDWGDAWGQSGWNIASDKNCKPMMVTSIGVFCFQNKKGIMICTGLDEQGQSNGNHFVPRGMIEKVKLLKPKNQIKVTY